MATREFTARNSLRRALGAVSPPEEITQEPFEQDGGHLRRLVTLESHEKARPDDLFAYMEDLRYTEIQTSLFAYLLPVCLEMWRDDLRGFDTRCAGVVEHF